MRIDDNIVAQARAADVLAFFEKYNGFTFCNHGGVYRCRQHPSLAVNKDRLSWFWHSKGIGGHGGLDFLIKIENMPFRQAIEVITGTTPTTAPPWQGSVKSRPLVLPEKAGIPLHLYDYLCIKRGIDNEVINALIQEKKIYEDKRGNIVFVGFDECSKARFASLRGTHGDCSFRMDCAGSDKRYGFNMACSTSERLYIFESALDAMSHASLENAYTADKNAWKRHNRLSLAGTSDTAIPFFLNKHTAVKKLILCLDNDPAGREAATIIARKYAEKGYRTQIELPTQKDFNQDLVDMVKKIRLENAQKTTVKMNNDICI